MCVPDLSASQVLHIDRNNYYGGESASLSLNQVGAAREHPDIVLASAECRTGSEQEGEVVWERARSSTSASGQASSHPRSWAPVETGTWTSFQSS